MFVSLAVAQKERCEWKDAVAYVGRGSKQLSDNASRRINDIMHVWKALGLLRHMPGRNRWSDGILLNLDCFAGGEACTNLYTDSVKQVTTKMRSRATVQPLLSPVVLPRAAMPVSSASPAQSNGQTATSQTPVKSPGDDQGNSAPSAACTPGSAIVPSGHVSPENMSFSSLQVFFITALNAPAASGKLVPKRVPTNSDLWPNTTHLDARDFKHHTTCDKSIEEYETEKKKNDAARKMLEEEESKLFDKRTPPAGHEAPARSCVTCSRCSQVHFNVQSDVIQCMSCSTFIWCGQEEGVSRIQQIGGRGKSANGDVSASELDCRFCSQKLMLPFEVLRKRKTSAGMYCVQVKTSPQLFRPWGGPDTLKCGGMFRCYRCKSIHCIAVEYIEGSEKAITQSTPGKKVEKDNGSATESETESEGEGIDAQADPNKAPAEGAFTVKIVVKGVIPCMDMIYAKSCENLKNTSLPLVSGSHKYTSWGVLPQNPEKLAKYHAEHYLYPIGFKSHREYWDVAAPAEKCVYVSAIEDGGMEGPLYTVTKLADPSIRFQNNTPSGVWKNLLEAISEAKAKRGQESTNSGTAISGPDMFGLSKADAYNVMQGLPGANKCRAYQFRGVMAFFALQNTDQSDVENFMESFMNSNNEAEDFRKIHKGFGRKLGQINRLKNELVNVRKGLRAMMREQEEKVRRLQMRRDILRIQYAKKYEDKLSVQEEKKSKESKHELRAKIRKECADLFDLQTFYIRSMLVRKDTGINCFLGTDRLGSRYYVLGGSCARLFIETKENRENFLISKPSEIEDIMDFLEPTGVNEGPLLKEIWRLKTLLLRTLNKQTTNVQSGSPNYDKVLQRMNHADLKFLAAPALRCLPKRSLALGSYLTGDDRLVLKCHRDARKNKGRIYGYYQQLRRISNRKHYIHAGFPMKVLKFTLLSVFDSTPVDALVSQLVIGAKKWHKTVLQSTVPRQLMGALLLLESGIREDVLADWYKFSYTYKYQAFKKKGGSAGKSLSVDGAATLMANATSALVMSRLLALDEAINYKFSGGKGRGGKRSSSGGSGRSTKRSKKTTAKHSL